MPSTTASKVNDLETEVANDVVTSR